jgi:hypothetical protein
VDRCHPSHVGGASHLQHTQHLARVSGQLTRILRGRNLTIASNLSTNFSLSVAGSRDGSPAVVNACPSIRMNICGHVYEQYMLSPHRRIHSRRWLRFCGSTVLRGRIAHANFQPTRQ